MQMTSVYVNCAVLSVHAVVQLTDCYICTGGRQGWGWSGGNVMVGWGGYCDNGDKSDGDVDDGG
jgi:hypothetical protein